MFPRSQVNHDLVYGNNQRRVHPRRMDQISSTESYPMLPDTPYYSTPLQDEVVNYGEYSPQPSYYRRISPDYHQPFTVYQHPPPFAQPYHRYEQPKSHLYYKKLRPHFNQHEAGLIPTPRPSSLGRSDPLMTDPSSNHPPAEYPSSSPINRYRDTENFTTTSKLSPEFPPDRYGYHFGNLSARVADRFGGDVTTGEYPIKHSASTRYLRARQRNEVLENSSDSEEISQRKRKLKEPAPLGASVTSISSALNSFHDGLEDSVESPRLHGQKRTVEAANTSTSRSGGFLKKLQEKRVKRKLSLSANESAKTAHDQAESYPIDPQIEDREPEKIVHENNDTQNTSSSGTDEQVATANISSQESQTARPSTAKASSKREKADRRRESRKFGGRIPWSDEEFNALSQGMKKHGKSWRRILADSELNSILAHRTVVDLKDKARNEFRSRKNRNVPLEEFRVMRAAGGGFGARSYLLQ